MDIMDELELEGLIPSAAVEPSGEWEDRKESQKEEDGAYPDPELLTYFKDLVSEDFVNKVGWLRALGSTRFQRLALQHPDLSSNQTDGISSVLCS